MTDTLDLTEQLLERQSITPEDDGCQALMADRLSRIGFKIEHLRFGDVDNLWARFGTEGPVFAFAGHTDVVPPGPREHWITDPFIPTVREGMLCARGAADMKTSLAAMVVATERFLAKHPTPTGSIAFLITSDEEGPAKDGTIKVIETLEARNEKITWCLVGEPSSEHKLADVVKNGRRGSLSADITFHGVQGHVAYPHLAENPVHLAMPALTELVNEVWDEGNAFYPPTSFQISNINAGTGAENVIPGDAKVMCNFRFCTEVTVDELKSRLITILDKHQLNYDITWRCSGQPFLTSEGDLVEATQAAVLDVMGYETQLSTAGGTSDGRFIAPTGAQVIELGPLNATIHKVNECVALEHLDPLTDIYEGILERLLS